MELDNNKLALAFLSIVVIASGCSHTGGSTSSSSSASVAIKNFSALPSNPYNTQPVTLRLGIKNTGDADAKGVVAKIFNIPLASTGSGSKTSWKISGNPSNARWKNIGELKAADPENDLPARRVDETWRLTAPNIDNDLQIPYTIKSRVYFGYNTTATTKIKLMTQRRFREVGGASRPTLDNTAGPIKLGIRTRTPIIYDTANSGSSDAEAEMCIIVRNTGKGTPFDRDDATRGSGDSLKYNLKDETQVVTTSIPNQAGIRFEPQEGTGKEVKLVGSRGTRCYDIYVDPSMSGQAEIEVPIKVEASYGYFKDTSQTVTVTGSSRFS